MDPISTTHFPASRLPAAHFLGATHAPASTKPAIHPPQNCPSLPGYNGGRMPAHHFIRFQGRETAEEKASIQYSGLFLNSDNPLKAIPIPEGWTRFAHHCTLQHRNDLPGKKITTFPEVSGNLTVTRILKTPEVLYALVEPPEAIQNWVTQQGIPTPPWHITIATAPGIKPMRAKEMSQLSDEAIRASGLSLESVDQIELPLALPFISGGFTRDRQIKTAVSEIPKS